MSGRFNNWVSFPKPTPWDNKCLAVVYRAVGFRSMALGHGNKRTCKLGLSLRNPNLIPNSRISLIKRMDQINNFSFLCFD